MGTTAKQRPVKLVASLIFKDAVMLEAAERNLKKRFGPIEDLTKDLPFDFTDYYRREFGSPLLRKLICFRKLVRVDGIERTKLATNELENRLRRNGARTVNIDPGYVTEAKLVLLTTKDYTHRVHIGRRIFAESTLHFREGAFRPWPWTYPDYASSEIIEYFDSARKIYLRDIKPRK